MPSADASGRQRFPGRRPVLCLVTDRARLTPPGDPGAVLDLIRAATAAGVDLVQIREPGLSDRTLGALVTNATAAARGASTRILVNDRVDIALAHGADGVHLKADSVPAPRVREHAGTNWIIGRSVHDLDEGRAAAAGGGLDYLLLGTIFETASKPGRKPLGATALGTAAAALPLPVLAIGGVTPARIPALAATGAAGAAAIGLFAELSASPPARLRKAVEEMRAAWRT